ncbi:MAG: dihydroneopterin triphosphate diphosphatase [Rhodoferax sp.]
MDRAYKIPESVLVLIHTPDLEVLLLNRVDAPGYWQCVTGSKDSPDETLAQTAAREVWEETGLDCRPGSPLALHLRDWGVSNVYEIYPQWRCRYAPGTLLNTEHIWSLQVPGRVPVRLAAREHSQAQWLPLHEAAWCCSSASNAEACLLLPRVLGGH